MADDATTAARRAARAELAHGDERAGARSHFRAMGIDPDRLEHPIVGVASMWTHTMPCNLNHRDLAAAVEQGVTLAGGVALAFNTIAVSDNQSQATPGMRASLVSRELIADSIELMDVAHDFDALVCIVGCDKTVPAALMALARIDKPSVVIYSGPMRAGSWRGQTATIQDVWEAVGARRQGQLAREELDTLERGACPGPGTCAGHFTANTMGLALEFLGLALPGTTMVAADELEQRTAHAAEAGALAVRIAADGPGARSFLQRRSLLNAFAGIAASGGSTNGVLHTLAISREAGVPLTLDDLFSHAAGVPVIASLTPGGRYVATEFQAVGGVPVLIRELIRAGLVDGAAPVVSGGTLAEAVSRRARPRRAGDVQLRRAVQGLQRAAGAARQPRARRRRGQDLRDRTAPAHRAGARLRQRRGVHDRRQRRRHRPRRRAHHPQRRAVRRAGDARDAGHHRRCRRLGARRVRRARHRRPLLGGDARPDGRARVA